MQNIKKTKLKMQDKKILAQGAEAIIYLEDKKIIKQRISKSYRIPELDNSIRKSRTKAEAKILEKVSKIIDVPKVIKLDEKNKEIILEFIDGKKLSENLNSFPLKEQKEIMGKIGESVAKLHLAGIIHGDLTTSNMIYKFWAGGENLREENPNSRVSSRRGDGDGKVYFIDFGLGFQNGKIEDKGVDIHLLKQALEEKHFQNWKILFNEFEKTYKKINKKDSKQIFERLNAIEKRGRYRH